MDAVSARSDQCPDGTVSMISTSPPISIARRTSTSIARKVLVALSGTFLAVFVLGHAAGNLQIFIGPEQINRYAWHLHSLPYGLIWVVRALVVGAVLTHVVQVGALHARNRRARGRGYARENYLAATAASRRMLLGGAAILLFLVWHILHFTTRSLTDFSDLPPWTLSGPDGAPSHAVTNVYAMMYQGFSDPLTAILYVAAVALLALHLSHGVASIFQSIGWRNSAWAPRMHRVAQVYAATVFIGLGSIPLAVLADAHLGVPIFDHAATGTNGGTR